MESWNIGFYCILFFGLQDIYPLSIRTEARSFKQLLCVFDHYSIFPVFQYSMWVE